MSLSAVIVDDEQLARDELAFLLKDVGDVDVVAQGKNGVEAVNLIREHNPDLVFLDVQMPGLDGFGVIKRLLDKKVALPQFVFATAYDQYAVKAFEVNAVDYLLKPFDKKRVAQSVQRVRAKMESEHFIRQAGDAGPHAGVAETASVQDPDQVQRPAVPGRSERHRFASIEDGVITVVTSGVTASRANPTAAPWKSCWTVSIPIFSGARTAPTW